MTRVQWLVVGCLTSGLAAFGGCGSDKDQPGVNVQTGPVTIAFLQHDNPSYDMANGVGFRAYEAAHAGVTIKTTTVQYSSLTATLLADLKNDRLPYDLLQVPGNWTCSFAANLADVPADVISLTDAQNVFYVPPLASSTCKEGGEDKLKGLPVEYNLEYGGVVVNLDKFQARLPGKTPSWTDWPSFIADAAALAEFDTDGTPRANGLDIDPYWPGPIVYIFLAQILQRHGQYWSVAGDMFNLTTPEARDAVADIVSWVNKDKVMSLSLSNSSGFVGIRLAHGETNLGWMDPLKPLAVMGYMGSWGVSAVKGIVPPQLQATRYDYVTLPPMVGTKHEFATYGGWAFAVPKSSKNQRLAWDIVKSIALDAAAMRQWSATTLALPALRVNGSAEAAMSNPLIAKVGPLLESGHYIGFMPATAIQVMEGAIQSNIFDVVRGTKPVDQALMDMQQKINEALKQKP